ncbi:MAG: sn-glycerol-3-phosphate ABC transporter ATP-binding protein UgpC [Aliivibrio sp.]|uniref:ABC transporter ATP-binding protein n=1 Tax=Aliivibrio sp. TaxID=1872443 RepID=UPI001A582A8C|nr:sn-glycerol-3-phosphate ABC transporter ATP-binding protein UgpC [Aliivibrio sp.]
MATLQMKKIRKTYRNAEQETLKGIDISIKSGEFLILVGPSGCGKSTLMNTIAGLEEINSGEILIDNIDVAEVEPKDRDIAMVFQSYALYPNMTVRGNIEFALKIRKMSKTMINQEVDRVAKLLQIEDLLERKPAQLSGGQKQRVAMGRALARKPKIYLFDEPLSNLDAKLRVEMRTQIKQLHQKLNTTIVYVTHDQIETMTLADRIAVMRDGELLQLGTPKEIYDCPNDMFVAGFMGSPSMNFIEITVSLNDREQPAAFVNTGSKYPQQILLPIALRERDGERVIMGIRPENITEMKSSSNPANLTSILDLRIDVLEPTGADTIAIAQIEGKKLACRISPECNVKVGDKMSVELDVTKAVFFDPVTTNRL